MRRKIGFNVKAIKPAINLGCIIRSISFVLPTTVDPCTKRDRQTVQTLNARSGNCSAHVWKEQCQWNILPDDAGKLALKPLLLRGIEGGLSSKPKKDGQP